MNKSGRQTDSSIFDAGREKEKLAGLLKTAGISAGEKRIGLLIRYSELIFEWNKKAGLISKNDIGKIIERHIFESLLLTMQECISGKVRLLDMGTGAGLPGIPLKIWNDEIDLVLVESNRKKVLFLEHAAETLDLGNTDVLCTRIEDLGRDPAFKGAFDIVTARALAPADQLLEWAKPFLTKKGNGRCMFPKGSRIEKELELIDKKQWTAVLNDMTGYLPGEGGKKKQLFILSAVITNT